MLEQLRPGYRLTAITMLSLLTAFGTLNVGAAEEHPDHGLISERPSAGGPPDKVTISFALLDIDEINDKAQRFSIDAYFEIRWHDHRLAINSDMHSQGGKRTVSLDDIWLPRLTIVNDRGLSLTLPQVADVDNDGNVVMRQRLSGPLAVDLRLRNFPFDTQRLAIDIVSYQYSPAELGFSAESEFLGDPAMFSADGWRFEILPPEFSEFRLDALSPGRSRLVLPVSAERHTGFYVLTLALPMALILFMAWMVHWLQPDIIPARISLSAASVFSLIALGVSFRLSLPQIGYLTRADLFWIYSTLLVLISLGITVMATRWFNQERQRSARRVTLLARWGLPVGFALIGALTPPI